MVLAGEDFEVRDAKTAEDLTRSILLQIILEEESGGVPMFSAQTLAQIIRFYGHAMQGMMGTMIEKNMQAFVELQNQFLNQSKGLYDPKHLQPRGLDAVPQRPGPHAAEPDDGLRRAKPRDVREAAARRHAVPGHAGLPAGQEVGAGGRAGAMPENRAMTASVSDNAAAAPAAGQAPTVAFVSLGCPKALTDSELILTQLRAEGYETSKTVRRRRPGRSSTPAASSTTR